MCHNNGLGLKCLVFKMLFLSLLISLLIFLEYALHGRLLTEAIILIKHFPSRYFCSGSFCFMSWCLNFFFSFFFFFFFFFLCCWRLMYVFIFLVKLR